VPWRNLTKLCSSMPQCVAFWLSLASRTHDRNIPRREAVFLLCIFLKIPRTGSAPSPYMEMVLQNPCLYRGYGVSCAGGQDDRTLGSRSARIASAEQESSSWAAAVAGGGEGSPGSYQERPAGQVEDCQDIRTSHTNMQVPSCTVHRYSNQ